MKGFPFCKLQISGKHKKNAKGDYDYSYVAVQLIEQKNALDFSSLKDMAETVEGSFTLQAIGRARGCQFNILRYQQEDALNTVLPLGLKRIDATRTLTTECTAVLMPFKSQEIQDAGGIYYGVN